MTQDQADRFADAVVQRAAEMLLAELRPKIDAASAFHQRRRKSAATPRPAARPSGGTVVSLNAWRIRKSAA
ncbi:hypothetical protein [Micromonospora sediminicola]|uniref:hypothetical protein n=1 Tax=Micromonospora sediminicola TaxID=946078 RepID=UPI00114684E5|nr:hypothetical protein [Micromonospora sediminicola]